MIKVRYSAIDGFRKTRSFKTLAGARKFVLDRVGPQDVEGSWYAVSNDGVGKVTWEGCTRAQLFADNTDEPRQKLNATDTFYQKGDGLFCRRQGSTYDHQHQQFGRVIPVMDNVTGDHDDGFALRHVNALQLFDEDRHYPTIEAARRAAKDAYLSYLEYLNSDYA
jgi:hypothetical protein